MILNLSIAKMLIPLSKAIPKNPKNSGVKNHINLWSLEKSLIINNENIFAKMIKINIKPINLCNDIACCRASASKN